MVTVNSMQYTCIHDTTPPPSHPFSLSLTPKPLIFNIRGTPRARACVTRRGGVREARVYDGIDRGGPLEEDWHGFGGGTVGDAWIVWTGARTVGYVLLC